jgi:hypothetical protein
MPDTTGGASLVITSTRSLVAGRAVGPPENPLVRRATGSAAPVAGCRTDWIARRLPGSVHSGPGSEPLWRSVRSEAGSVPDAAGPAWPTSGAGPASAESAPGRRRVTAARPEWVRHTPAMPVSNCRIDPAGRAVPATVRAVWSGLTPAFLRVARTDRVTRDSPWPASFPGQAADRGAHGCRRSRQDRLLQSPYWFKRLPHRKCYCFGRPATSGHGGRRTVAAVRRGDPVGVTVE